jgi:hypothetical protein
MATKEFGFRSMQDIDPVNLRMSSRQWEKLGLLQSGKALDHASMYGFDLSNEGLGFRGGVKLCYNNIFADYAPGMPRKQDLLANFLSFCPIVTKIQPPANTWCVCASPPSPWCLGPGLDFSPAFQGLQGPG